MRLSDFCFVIGVSKREEEKRARKMLKNLKNYANINYKLFFKNHF